MRLLTFALILAVPAVALADEPTDEQRAEATRLLEKGNQLYEDGEYGQALEAYRAAFEQTGAPGFLFNIAQAYRLEGNCVDARSHYEQFLDAAPQTSNKAQVQELITEMEACVLERRARLLPEQPAADPEQPDADVQPLARDRPPSTSGLRTFGLITIASGLALGGVGTVFALDARSKSNDLDGFEGEWTQDQINKERDGKRARSAGIVLIAAGGAAVAGGIVMYALGARSGDESSSPVTLDISGSSAVVGFGGRF